MDSRLIFRPWPALRWGDEGVKGSPGDGMPG